MVCHNGLYGYSWKISNSFSSFPTLITVLIPGKSIHKALTEFADHLESLLARHGFSILFTEYQVNTKPEIFATNSKSILAYLNDMKYTIEYHLVRQSPLRKLKILNLRIFLEVN